LVRKKERKREQGSVEEAGRGERKEKKEKRSECKGSRRRREEELGRKCGG
jgi:hypothetical protein